MIVLNAQRFCPADRGPEEAPKQCAIDDDHTGRRSFILGLEWAAPNRVRRDPSQVNPCLKLIGVRPYAAARRLGGNFYEHLPVVPPSRSL